MNNKILAVVSINIIIKLISVSAMKNENFPLETETLAKTVAKLKVQVESPFL